MASMEIVLLFPFFFFFNDTATTEIYTLSLHDALPIYIDDLAWTAAALRAPRSPGGRCRSEEHTSELQSHHDIVCRLLLEKKKQNSSERATQESNRNLRQSGHRQP